MADGWSDGLLESGFGSARVAELVSWPARVRAMVDVERALATAQAKVGILTDEQAGAVAQACDRAHLDFDALAAAAARSTTPMIPLLQALREAAAPEDLQGLHWGTTSQDVIDTATLVQVRQALRVLDDLLAQVGDRLAELADDHRGTVSFGRTLGQHAVPITFGLRAARWLGAVDRRRQQLRQVRERVLVVQLGGVAGTLAMFEDKGQDLIEALADELGLGAPDLPWHAERDRIVELAGALAGVVAVVGTTATDLVLLSQTEIAEVREAPDAGAGSSALAHKVNPRHATAARAAARLALGDLTVLLGAHEHELERAAGAWQAEWSALPSALVRTAGGVERLRDALDKLEIDPKRSAQHVGDGAGIAGSEMLTVTLAEAVGRTQAKAVVADLVASAVRQQRSLTAVASADDRVTAVLSGDDVARVLDPAASLRAVDALIDRALATHARLSEDAHG